MTIWESIQKLQEVLYFVVRTTKEYSYGLNGDSTDVSG